MALASLMRATSILLTMLVTWPDDDRISRRLRRHRRRIGRGFGSVFSSLGGALAIPLNGSFRRPERDRSLARQRVARAWTRTAIRAALVSLAGAFAMVAIYLITLQGTDRQHLWQYGVRKFLRLPPPPPSRVRPQQAGARQALKQYLDCIAEIRAFEKDRPIRPSHHS